MGYTSVLRLLFLLLSVPSSSLHVKIVQKLVVSIIGGVYVVGVIASEAVAIFRILGFLGSFGRINLVSTK
jgi:hypothetical protein